MTKKGKKRLLDETESKNEEQNVKNKKQLDKNSPKKKKKLESDDLVSKKEQITYHLKDSEETKLSPHKLKKKKNKKDKKHEKLDGIETDISQSESKKKKKNKKDKKREKINSVEGKNQDTEYTSKSKKEHEKINSSNEDAESASTSKKKKNKKHKKHKQSDKLDKKSKSNVEKSDNKSVTKVEKVISSKRKAKFTKKRKEFRDNQRKLVRQEEGQHSSINKLSLEEMKQKIVEIENRENVSNTAIRKLRSLKKKVLVEEEGNADNVETQKRKRDEFEEHQKDGKNKKIKEESLNDNKKSIESPSKKEKESSPKKFKKDETPSKKEKESSPKKFKKDESSKKGKESSPKKFKKDEHNLSKQMTKKQLFIEDRIGNTTNKDKQEKQQITRPLFIEDKIGTALPKNKIDSPSKKHEKLEGVKSKKDTKKSWTNFNKQFKGEIEEYDSNSEVNLINKQINGKNKIKIGNLDFKSCSNDESDQIQRFDSDFTKNMPQNVHAKQLEIKKNKSPELKKVNNKKLKTELIENLDKEEGELGESDSEDDSYSKSDGISLKKEIKANNKKSPKSLSNQNKNEKKFDQKSSDKEEGELGESDSEDSDSEDDNYSNSDDISLENELIINEKGFPQSSKAQKKNKFEQKSLDKEEGELQENGSDNGSSSQSDNAFSHLQAQHVLKQMENQKPINEHSGKKQRFVLFLGNLPYETTTVDLKKHFLTKVTKVKDVRIPLDRETRKPRGFGYIEVESSEDYEKALSLHGTFVKGRPIKVQYTAPGSKKAGNKKEIIHKNKKLHAMRKAGKLAGSTKDSQKRSFRRNFKKERTQK